LPRSPPVIIVGDPPPPRFTLSGTSWELDELRAQDARRTVRPEDTSRYTLSFDRHGNVTVRLDCNRGSGRFAATPIDAPGPLYRGTLTFGPMAVTRAMCPPGSLGTRLARELSAVRSYVGYYRQLRLELASGGGEQIWIPPPR
jgi:para-nitrobenzyl esterase